MMKNYSKNIALSGQELKHSPPKKTLDFILNYSKSTSVAKKNKKSIVLFLN